MRSLLFQTPPVLVEGADQVVLLKDMDGCDPFTLFVDNLSRRATLRTRYGSKNANLLFTVVAPGSGGNDVEVSVGNNLAPYPTAPSQAFGVTVAGNVITVSLRTDSSGVPNLTANDVAARLNADPDVAALVRVTLARGSDGGAVLGLLGDTDPANVDGEDFTLVSDLGGFDATALGDVDVFTSPNGAPDFPGPWEALSTSVFDSLAAEAVKSLAFVDAPVRGLKVAASPGPYPTKIVISAVSGHPSRR